MKRRDVIKGLTLLPMAGSVFPLNSLSAAPVAASTLPSTPVQNKPMPGLHREAFVMDGHTHVIPASC